MCVCANMLQIWQADHATAKVAQKLPPTVLLSSRDVENQLESVDMKSKVAIISGAKETAKHIRVLQLQFGKRES